MCVSFRGGGAIPMHNANYYSAKHSRYSVARGCCALEAQHNTAGLALSAANRHQIYGTLKLTEQSLPLNGRHVEKKKLLPLREACSSARYIAVSHTPLFSPSKLIRFSSGAMTASINDSRAQIKGI